ncbi:MAG: hypothetical protein IJX62_05165 [Clostridia bacterium]|nr:hypothetical protein [Clostridia bacterium]
MNAQPPKGTGYLIIRATTARGAIPLEGATVNVRSQPKSPFDEPQDLLYSTTTGRDGKTRPLPLATPPRSMSQQPGNGVDPPYASYIAEVRLEGYYDENYSSIPIFDGITAIQSVDMIPLPENGKPDGYPPDGERFFESSSAPNLS